MDTTYTLWTNTIIIEPGLIRKLVDDGPKMLRRTNSFIALKGEEGTKCPNQGYVEVGYVNRDNQSKFSELVFIECDIVGPFNEIQKVYGDTMYEDRPVTLYTDDQSGLFFPYNPLAYFPGHPKFRNRTFRYLGLIHIKPIFFTLPILNEPNLESTTIIFSD